MATNYMFRRLPVGHGYVAVVRRINALAEIPKEITHGTRANKEVMNRVYAAAESSLHETLTRHDLAAWLSIALEEFDRHTSLHADCGHSGDDHFEAAKSASAMRFCWRYVVDYSLRNLQPGSTAVQATPNLEDVAGVATTLAIMHGAADASDWLHRFPEIYEGVEGHYKPDQFAPSSLRLPSEAEGRKAGLQRRLGQKRVDLSFDRLLPPFEEDSDMRGWLNRFLKKHYRMTVEELQEFAGCVADMFRPEVMDSTVLIGTFDDFAEQLHGRAGFSKSKARTYLQLILQDASEAKPRNFLQRARRKRMGFYGGVRIPAMRLPARLRAPSWGATPPTWADRAQDVVIVSALSCIDAVLLQLSYLVTAQVDHLGTEPIGLQDMANLQEQYRVNCFEGEVRELFRAAAWTVIGPVKEMRRSKETAPLPCGEIDALAVSPDRKTLLVVEAKCLSLSIDPQMWHTDSTDFSRKYVPRIEKKVDWCTENKALIEDHLRAAGVEVNLTNAKVRSLFVTLHPHIAGVLQSKHLVMEMSAVAAALAKGTLAN